MNSKTTRYALITVVLFVWGSVLYRVFAGLNHPDKKINVEPLIKASYVENKVDTFSLLANYDDPFLPDDQLYADDLSLLDSVNINTEKSVENNTATPTVKQEAKPPDFSFIKYTGLLSNPENKIKIAFMNVKGKDYMAKEKDSIEGIKIKKISQEKILISYEKKQIEILKTH